MSNLPNVPITAEAVIEEYHARLANLTAANIRLTIMTQTLVGQRDDALKRWQEEKARNDMPMPGV